MSKKKVLDQINDRFDDMTNRWARGNGYGIPISHEAGTLELETLSDLRFKQRIPVTNPLLPTILREVADILEEFF